MELFLVRHGQSIGNTMPHQDMPDSALTELGREQANKVSELLKQLSVNRIVSSPLVRAMQTAQPLSRALGIPILVWRNLCELREGASYVGPSLDQLIQLVPEAVFPETMEKDGWLYTGGEHHEIAARRAQEALLELQQLKGERIAVFCHGFFNEFIIREACGIPNETNIRFPQSNTAVNHLVFQDSIVEVHMLNRLEHLDNEMRT